MQYLWVIKRYTCPNGHRTEVNKFIEKPTQEVTDDMLHSRLGLAIKCSSCASESSATSSPGQAVVQITMRVLTKDQLDELGATAEPWDVSRQ